MYEQLMEALFASISLPNIKVHFYNSSWHHMYICIS